MTEVESLKERVTKLNLCVTHLTLIVEDTLGFLDGCDKNVDEKQRILHRNRQEIKKLLDNLA